MAADGDHVVAEGASLYARIGGEAAVTSAVTLLCGKLLLMFLHEATVLVETFGQTDTHTLQQMQVKIE